MSTPSRPRAPRMSPAERALSIANAARALALEAGLAAVTLRAVAARAGVAPALVAHYVPSMDVLIARTFASVVSAEVVEIETLLEALPGPREQLGVLVRTILDGSRDDVTLVWVEAWALGRRNETLATEVRAQMDAWQAVIQSVIEAGVAAGEFETEDPAAVAWQLLGMVDGLNAQALVRWGDLTDRGSLISHAVEGMLGLPRGALDLRA
ncbi:TetR family transcriptional regulator C-terminal domain-containing protein [Agromyces mediolanus]|uniref:TetR family transcriptional regulator C-terminal domain-containing protein n=1 Tax=Agromyces mediolanus TaxID=41986 RepID=UPI00204152C3|nr:TetR family transcriptional regulator C-terminal domain-containing protein [Agromyces mediolanus]MCM3657927.1 TetR family transcriptional regulator C-terminal domain-containing protein [Agromyces mediolanus]